MMHGPIAILHYGRSGMMDNAIYVAFFLRAVGQDLDSVLGYEEGVLVLRGGLPVRRAVHRPVGQDCFCGPGCVILRA